MAEWPKLNAAPITEALLDIRASLPAETDLDRLATFHESILDRYPTKRERSHWETQFELQPGGMAGVKQSQGGVDGYLFISKDETEIVQARRDGFTFNKLKPYVSWMEFRTEGKRLWDHYREIASPVSASRIALRYINKIDLPLPVDLKEYIRTTPEIAPALPQALSGFFMRLVLPFEKRNCTGIITLTLGDPQRPDCVALVFDIDVYREGTFNAQDEMIWTFMEDLRNTKNDIFFKSLTPKTMDLFNASPA